MTPPRELSDAFRARPYDAHKRSVGVVAVVGGSARYPHAPAVSALGARAAGAGLVHLVAPDESRFAAGALVPEATFGRLCPACVPPRTDVVVAGMGLGVSPGTRDIVAGLLAGECARLVLDADALSVLAELHGEGGLGQTPGRELVLTPHEGEAARLLGWTRGRVSSDRRLAVRAIAGRYGATVILKGPRTLVSPPDGAGLYENATGNPAMALGGMGDLLAGVVGARWAYLGGDPFQAAASSAWLHGAASDAVVAAGRDPSLVNTAAEIGALRARLDMSAGAARPEPPPFH